MIAPRPGADASGAGVKAAVTVAILAAAALVTALLARLSEGLHLRGFHSGTQQAVGVAAWAAASLLLVLLGLSLGRVWLRRIGPVRSTLPVSVAFALPLLAAAAGLSFEYPLGWPGWLDMEAAGVIGVLAGGMLGALLFRASPAEDGARTPGRVLLGLWSCLALAAGTGAVLFLE